MEFKGNCNRPIIAWDFDGIITEADGHFPDAAPIRKYIPELINVLHDGGIVNVIWTCRQDNDPVMLSALANAGIKYDAINTSLEWAPWHYESRKIFAHIYIDDRNLGWVDSQYMLDDIMQSILMKLFRLDKHDSLVRMASLIVWGNNTYREEVCDGIKYLVHRWGV